MDRTLMNNRRMNRRSWLGSAAAALSLARFASAAEGNFKHALGVQLYTVRNVWKGHEDEELRRIAEIGYTEVETTGENKLDMISPMLKKYKLKAVSTHLSDGAAIKPETIETAKKYGVEYLVYPYVPPSERGSADGYRKLADQMNEAGQKCHAAGLTFCYHNHAFEFGGEMGQRPIDIFNERLDKKLVNFEVDVFWISVAGGDPAAFLKEHAGRVPLVHLKDKAQGTPVQYNENVPAPTFKEVGSGSLDFAAILKTAASVGVKHFFVEQDQTPGDPIDSLKKSYDYLRSVKV
jgi:sugar phosphate isomerase/epimerase